MQTVLSHLHFHQSSRLRLPREYRPKIAGFITLVVLAVWEDHLCLNLLKKRSSRDAYYPKLAFCAATDYHR